MANPDGNPDIAKIGEGTHFGEKRMDTEEQARKGGEMKGAMRAKLRKLSCAEINIDVTGANPPTITEIAKAAFGKDLSQNPKLRMAEVWALQKHKQAMANWKAMDTLIDHVDGKQVQKTIEAKVTLADIINGNFEGADDESKE